MQYTKNQVINTIQKELSNIESLYKSGCVNWRGKTKDTDELYSEIIANELLQELKEFKKISTVRRTESYCRENHCNMKIDICDSNRGEENFAKRITGLTIDGLGLIIDFQIPLKNTRSDDGLGKIDLISFNEETNTLYLLELKYEGNNETLLRASLESYTYYKIVDKAKLINDCFSNQKSIFNKIYNHINPADIKVKPAVLAVPNCNAYAELEDVELGDRPKLKALALALDIRYFTIEFLVSESIL